MFYESSVKCVKLKAILTDTTFMNIYDLRLR